MRPVPGQISFDEALGIDDPTGLLQVAPPQTRLKHAMYRKYLAAWLRVMKGQPGGHDLYILDLFAGPGAYLAEGVKAAGSPVIAAELAMKLRLTSPSTRVHIRCVERSRVERERLDAELERFRPDIDCTVQKGTAERHAAAFAAESAGHPTLVLLDPDGIGVPMSLISTFGQRDYTEVLVSFDAHAHYRVAGTQGPTAVTAFWGDESWTQYQRQDGTLDLAAMLEGYRLRIQERAGFRYAAIWRIRFPKGHIDRAVAQAAGSTLAPEIMFDVLTKEAQKFDARIQEVAAELDRRGRINGALRVIRAFAGEVGVSWSRLYARAAGVCPASLDLEQALLYMREIGHVTWCGRLGRYAAPPAKFTFVADLPEDRWDGLERSQDAAAALVGRDVRGGELVPRSPV